MQIILLDKKYSLAIMDKYEELLNVKGKLKRLDLKMFRVWDGCGTISIHTYPIITGMDIIQLIQDVKLIMGYINDENYIINSACFHEWEYTDTEPEELIRVNKDNISIIPLICFAIILYGKEKAIFKIGNILSKEESIVRRIPS